MNEQVGNRKVCKSRELGWSGAAHILLALCMTLGLLLGGWRGSGEAAAAPAGTPAPPELVMAAKQISLAFLMYYQDKKTFPAASGWQSAIGPYVKDRAILSGLEYNATLAGKTMEQLPSPSQTALIYASGADRAANGDSVLVGFLDGHVTSVDPAAVIWAPGKSAGQRGSSPAWLLPAIIAAGVVLVGIVIVWQVKGKGKKQPDKGPTFAGRR